MTTYKTLTRLSSGGGISKVGGYNSRYFPTLVVVQKKYSSIMVINRRRLSNARIARVAFTALLFTAYFVIYDLNKLTLSYHPSSSLNKTIHTQRKFSDSIELNIQRGLNIINIRSGQHVAAWIYDGYMAASC
jgi:hypothetical protein